MGLEVEGEDGGVEVMETGEAKRVYRKQGRWVIKIVGGAFSATSAHRFEELMTNSLMGALLQALVISRILLRRTTLSVCVHPGAVAFTLVIELQP